MDSSYHESQYNVFTEYEGKYGKTTLGPMSSFTWNNDPKRLLFMLARYKSVASLLRGSKHALEIGCGDSFASRIVCQTVSKLTVTDIDSELLGQAKLASKKPYEYETIHHDFSVSPLISTDDFDCAYLLDVLEHIQPQNQDNFLLNIKSSLLPYSKVLIGMPSLESQVYASKESAAGHVNCQTKLGLQNSLSRIFPLRYSFFNE